MIRTTGIHKRFGQVHALRGVDLEVSRGEVLGLLGHNGAGKTTLINVLSTLYPLTSGSAEVAGFDVARDPRSVRGRIGVTGQFAALDEALSGTGNLVLVARLSGATRRQARQRAADLIEAFDLTHAANRPARTYSGGMRRRLDLAIGLVSRPDVLFLDEPTTGLDLPSRRSLWHMVEELTAAGTTVLLTTQYLDEADRLSDRITVLGEGQVIASGTAAELKGSTCTGSVFLRPAGDCTPDEAARTLATGGLRPTVDHDDRSVSVPAVASTELAVVVRLLDAAGQEVAEIRYREPSLDDVYLALIGDGAQTSVQEPV
ncbi:ATP-binding cassette domain-containing protein [Streptomyces sp. NBC_00838]|uniref:ATP-binding cassette domain-containing protein n=1 Tax=Streptomyces sp. NBC_00838 TaxID=2903680 RepID=UPI0038632974|nr:ATP-binding cassette domain-containing protein [Streptomyces sp. NBC_00838]